MAFQKNLFGLLYLISKAPQGFEERRRLQKMVLIANLDKKISYGFSFEYFRHFYGPYSFQLKALVDQLVNDSILTENIAGRKYVYKLSELGKKLLENLLPSCKDEQKKIDLLWRTYSTHKPFQLILIAKQLYGW